MLYRIHHALFAICALGMGISTTALHAQSCSGSDPVFIHSTTGSVDTGKLQNLKAARKALLQRMIAAFATSRDRAAQGPKTQTEKIANASASRPLPAPAKLSKSPHKVAPTRKDSEPFQGEIKKIAKPNLRVK